MLAGAGASASAQSTERGIATLEAFLDEVHSLRADFEQELWSAGQELEQTDSGSLWMKRPNRFRWEYKAPAELTVVSDGTDRPYRVRCRPPCWFNLAACREMITGEMIADIVPTFGSINMIGGECDR